MWKNYKDCKPSSNNWITIKIVSGRSVSYESINYHGIIPESILMFADDIYWKEIE